MSDVRQRRAVFREAIRQPRVKPDAGDTAHAQFECTHERWNAAEMNNNNRLDSLNGFYLSVRSLYAILYIQLNCF